MFGADAGQLVSGLLGQLNKSLRTEAKLPSELDLTAKITGTIDKPVVKPVFAVAAEPNVKETIKEEIKQELNEQIDKVKDGGHRPSTRRSCTVGGGSTEAGRRHQSKGTARSRTDQGRSVQGGG
jgi:hypothetical protein